ncbi:MAG: UbiA family prenyltransferase [Saprospiraceae bacterium]|nr:UbiA family prenyltransferase [Saprospiraceae bacterium]
MIGINKVKKFAHKGRFAVIEKFKSHILVYAVLSFILCCYLFLDFEWSRIVIISGAGIISVLYTIPIFGKSMRLRDFSFIKIFLIAIVWAYVTGSVPLYEQGAPMGEIILYFLVVVFFFIAITIPFDIRDFYVDSTNKVLTIPILLGKDRSIKLTFGLLSATVLFDLLLMLYYHPPVIGTISISVTCLIVGLIIYRIRHKESDYYFSGLLDTVIMFPYTIITLIGFF